MVAARSSSGTPFPLLALGPALTTLTMLIVPLRSDWLGTHQYGLYMEASSLLFVLLADSCWRLCSRAGAASTTVSLADGPSQLPMDDADAPPPFSSWGRLSTPPSCTLTSSLGRTSCITPYGLQVVSLVVFLGVLQGQYLVLQWLTVDTVFGMSKPGVSMHIRFNTFSFVVRLVGRGFGKILDRGKTGSTSFCFLAEIMVGARYYSFYRMLFTHFTTFYTFLLRQAVHLASEWIWAVTTTRRCTSSFKCKF